MCRRARLAGTRIVPEAAPRSAARLRPAHDQPNVRLLRPPVLGRIRSQLRSGLGQGAKPTGPQWLDGYTGQTTAELLALEGGFRTDSIVLAFEQAIAAKAARLGDQTLTEPERVVLAVEALEREVNSDGYSGLFTTAPEHVPDAVSSLTAIGSDGVADLTRSAISVLKIRGPLTREAVASAMQKDDDDRDDKLGEFDQGYYETAGDLAGPLLSFIKANRDQIVLT